MKKEIIFGAPGCGKTTYLIDILEKELKTYQPDRIAFVSFTKQGAKEGLHRALEHFEQYKEKDFKYFRTIHSLCFSALHTGMYDMMGKKDYRILSKALGMKFIGYYTEDFYHNDDRYLFLYFLKHNNYGMYLKLRDTLIESIDTLKYVAHNYNRYKEHFNKIDFTDLLKNIISKEITLDLDVAIIDEAQDLTTLQWEVIEMLFKDVKKMYIAGDDDQAIYEWNGADVNKFLSQKGKITVLDKSWRLQTTILNFVQKITLLIGNRKDKQFEPYKKGGDIQFYNTIEDFYFKPDESYYCLSRNNYFLKRFRVELRKQSKVYIDKTKLSVDKNIIFAINNYYKYVSGELDNEKDKLKVLSMIKKDMPHSSLARINWFDALNIPPEEIFYYRKLIENKVNITSTNIIVNTIHGVKGGEADNVILLLDVTKAVYKQLYELSDSELRVLYVACTRAKKSLHIIYAESKYSYRDILNELLEEGEKENDK